MALFVVKTEDKVEVRNWFDETIKRGGSDNVLKNPFKWRLKRIKTGRELLLVCDVEPVIFNFSIFGWLTAISVYFIWGAHWVVWAGVFVGMLTYFWSSDFYYQMTKVALRRKAKYQGFVKKVRLSELIREVVL